MIVKWDGAKVLLKPAPEGTGVIAGYHARHVFELGGVKDIVSKNLGSNNPLNLVRAITEGLAQLSNRQETIAMREEIS
jgi:small subunit ribosomal protein S5